MFRTMLPVGLLNVLGVVLCVVVIAVATARGVFVELTAEHAQTGRRRLWNVTSGVVLAVAAVALLACLGLRVFIELR